MVDIAYKPAISFTEKEMELLRKGIEATNIPKYRNSKFIVAPLAGYVVVAGTNYTLYNVTTGKKFYLTGICFYTGDGQRIVLYDKGEIKFITINYLSNFNFNFNPPLEFSTNILMNFSVDQTIWYTLIGYEE